MKHMNPRIMVMNTLKWFISVCIEKEFLTEEQAQIVLDEMLKRGELFAKGKN